VLRCVVRDHGANEGISTGGTNWFDPNSAKGKVTDKQWLSVVAPKGMDGMESRELFSTTAGPFCYVYQ
jgi:tyrosinase